jgi:hypothetical protein
MINRKHKMVGEDQICNHNNYSKSNGLNPHIKRKDY